MDISPVFEAADFFALGGTSLQAVQLVERLERRLGRRIPLSRFFADPTLGGLVQALQQQPSAAARYRVELKKGSRGAPFFVLPPLGGTTRVYKPLADALGDDRPVIGIHAVGVDGEAEPLNTIEEMADSALRTLEDHWPAGPVLLGGYSAGAFVAVELATRLEAQGRQVGAVVLFDAQHPSARYHEVPFTPAYLARVAAHAWLPLYELAHTPVREWSAKLRVKLRKVAEKTGLRSVGDEALWQELFHAGEAPPAPHLVRLWEAQTRAARAYSEKAYGGTLTLVRARFQPMVCRHDLTLGWGKLAGGLEIYDVTGNHLNILETPGVLEVARHLTRRFRGY
jgi:thioesterase domain-containing protein/acyl carrier protein